MFKTKKYNRILSAILAAVLLLGVLPLSVFCAGDNTLDILLDGARIDQMDLRPHEKIEIQAQELEADAQYQWQILHPEKEDLWVNIYDAKDRTIPVTLALVGNMLSGEDTAQLRCRAEAGERTWCSDPVTVRLCREEPVEADTPGETFAQQAADVVDAALSAVAVTAHASEITDNEFVTVTIEYLRYDYEQDEHGNLVLVEDDDPAFTPYEATLRRGGDLTDTTVTFPTMIGYDTWLVENGADVQTDKLTFDLTNIQTDVKYTVKYKPTNVKYVIRYYLQNIYDDLYVENTGARVELDGETGDEPDAAAIGKTFDGFTSLYYQPDTIAADGSTVFEVYYERNYYLMEFDCNGGYGADTVYVRYGTYISIPNPVKAGYVFAGWDLVRSDNPDAPVTAGDGVKDDLLAEMPCYNTAYKAIWAQADTTYSVAYWIVNDDGTRSYLGGTHETGTSGTKADGQHNLGTGDGNPYICGSEAHTHTDECFTCGSAEHDHQLTCFTTWYGNQPGPNGEAAIKELENGGSPETGYIYVIKRDDTGARWPKLYLGGYYYTVNGVGEGSAATDEQLATIIEGPALGSVTGTYGTEPLTVTKYRAKADCGHVQHIHGDSCRRCEAHTHDATCKMDDTYLQPVTSVTVTKKDGTSVTYTTDTGVTILGDGSTVVNVYYQYKQYTLKFYYARTTGGTATDKDNNAATYDTIEIAGGNTWSFGNADVPGPDDGSQLANVGGWGLVDELPTLNAEGQGRNYTAGTLTYGNYTYHYISFKARYGDDISALWPCSVFNSVTRVESNTHGYWSGMEAFVSAWNGEHRVKYSQDHQNETIKGKYELLDENLLFDLSKFEDSDEVSYLCFWENGFNIYWSVPELYRYNIYLEAYSGQDLTGLTTTEWNGKTYYLADSYDTVDDSDVNNQTQVSLAGYESAGRTSSKMTSFDTSLYREAYDVNFFYNRRTHKLSFWNHDGFLTDGSGAMVAYGEPLKKRFEGSTVGGVEYEGANDLIAKPEKYPSTLEPGAYVFDGWYTTPEFHTDTKVNENTLTMPDAKLRVYAKWIPVVHDVYFYHQYDDIKDTVYWKGEEVAYPIKINHGDLLGTAYNEIPERAGYTFVGWFYMDENNKKRFAPDSMEVTRELHLFAEWQSSIDTTYEVTYVLKEDATIGGVAYPAGTEIADKTAGHITAGQTKTFNAKGGTDLTLKFRDQGLFPTTSSHSILMDEDSTQNVFKFEYVQDDQVWYKVRYINAVTGQVLGESDAMSTTHAIVTEKFKPFEGYIPQSYYITKPLMADGKADRPIDENIITFYYTPDTTHGLYSIEYYLENLDSTDSTNPANYTRYEYTVGQSDLVKDGESVIITAVIRAYDGYTHKPAMNTVITYNEDGTVKQTSTNVKDAQNRPYGTIEYTGLTIQLYYSREEYPCMVEYRNAGDNSLLTPKDSNVAAPLAPVYKKYGEEHSHTAVASFVGTDGYTYEYYIANANETQRTQTRTVQKEDNTLVFYYVQKQVEVRYHPVCLSPDVPEAMKENMDSIGTVSLNAEKALTKENLAGSTAAAAEGFTFVGWYSDAACTDLVTANAHFKPEELDETDDWINHYYALFEPAEESLTIRNEGENLGTDTFLYRVQGTNFLGQDVDLMVSIQGMGSVTIQSLYRGEYTVTELTGWSWAYGCGKAEETVILTTTDNVDSYTVTFHNSPNTVDWLHGESGAAENQFKFNKTNDSESE